MSAVIQNLVNQPYKHGFVTDIESDVVAKGLSEDVIRLISAKKGEPEWLLEFRLKAYRHWLTMTEPVWPNVKYPKIDFQDISYFSAPKPKKLASMDEVDPELLRTFEKLGVPMNERQALAGVAVDVIFDSVSVATTYKKKLAEVGVIFCSFSEAVKDHPELVRKYLGSVVPAGDNFYAALNSAVFTDGSFCFIPRGVRCPMESVDLLSHQHPGIGTVRAHVDHRGGRRPRVLPRRLYGAKVRYQPAACGGGGTGDAGRCRDQVLDGAELVRRRRERQGRHLQFRDQARFVQGREFENFLDPGRDRIGDHLEVSVLYFAGRQFGGRVLLGGADQSSPAGRYRDQDDPHRQEHAQQDHFQGHLRRCLEQQLPRPGEDRRKGAKARATSRNAIRC